MNNRYTLVKNNDEWVTFWDLKHYHSWEIFTDDNGKWILATTMILGIFDTFEDAFSIVESCFDLEIFEEE